MAEPSIAEIIGRNIRTLRDAGLLTQEEVAEQVRMSPSQYNLLENGKVKRPHPSTLRKIADFFGVAPQDLRNPEGILAPKAPALQRSAEERLQRELLSEAGPEFPEGQREVENWTRFINEWAGDLEEWAYGFHKGADPAELPERKFLAFVGGMSVAGEAHGRAQKIVEPLARQYEAEDLARAWRRLSRAVQAMFTSGVKQRLDELVERDELPDNVRHLPTRKTA